MTSENRNELNLLNVYRLIVRNWKVIALVCLINVVLASVILYFTPNTYKNVTVFFPASDQLVDRSTVLNELTPLESSIFAPENIVDRVYNIATSATVQNYVIAKEDLIRHYGYDPNNTKAYEKTAKKYAKNVTISRTAYNSMELVVKDQDYIKASDIANDVLDKTEEIYHRFLAEFRDSVINNIESNIDQRLVTVQSWSDSLAHLRDQYHFFGVIGANMHQATIPSAGSVNGKGFETIQNLESLKEKTLEDISSLRTIQNQLRISQADNTFMLHVIEKPTPSKEKAGPFRTIIVLLTLIFTFFGMIVILILFEQFKWLKSHVND